MTDQENSTIKPGFWLSLLKEAANIISSVSNTTKLLALVVLVAAAAIIIAMFAIPADDQRFSIYLYILIGLLLITLIAIFVDRQAERKTNLKRDTTLVRTTDNQIAIEERKGTERSGAVVANFTDNRLRFKIYSPEKNGWHKPRFLSYKDYLVEVGLVANEAAADDTLAKMIALHEYGSMIAESDNVLFQYGAPILIETIPGSTNKDIEDQLTRLQKYFSAKGTPVSDEEIEQERERLMQGGPDPFSIYFTNSVHIQVYQKAKAPHTLSMSHLSRLFVSLFSASKEPIDQLTGSDKTISWICRTRLINVKANGMVSNFTIYRIYKLIETTNHFFVAQVQWSPDADLAEAVWDELKKMADSFAVLDA
jgi:hypothetical protein